MLKEFKQFIGRGNVLDLAVAVIMGGAFGAIVTYFVNDQRSHAHYEGVPALSTASVVLGPQGLAFGTFDRKVPSIHK